jgi:archaellum component FlaG (FlaF/FlaG flagellin family)
MKKLLFILVLVMGALVVNAQTTPVKVADLQKSITDNITKDYAGFTIKEANKVVVNNVTTFNVVITKGTTQETLCYDNTGKFLKKMEAKGGMSKPESKPAVKPTPKKN